MQQSVHVWHKVLTYSFDPRLLTIQMYNAWMWKADNVLFHSLHTLEWLWAYSSVFFFFKVAILKYSCTLFCIFWKLKEYVWICLTHLSCCNLFRSFLGTPEHYLFPGGSSIFDILFSPTVNIWRAINVSFRNAQLEKKTSWSFLKFSSFAPNKKEVSFLWSHI